MSHKIVIRNGVLSTLYTDTLPLHELGQLEITRASNVEYDAHKQGWTVQLADGMYLADTPYPPDELYITGIRHHAKAWLKREDALAAEVAYINARL